MLCYIDLPLINNILYSLHSQFHPEPNQMQQFPFSTQLPPHQTLPQYTQIKKLLQQYKRVIQQKFQSNEFLLIQQLEQKTLKLKQEIAFYKKQTSNENIEKMISQRRHQKEAQRLQLEVHWRNLTEKYKKLQEEEKIINQQNAESKFDIDNLEKKIQQLKEANKSMAHRIQLLKASENSQQFMTEVNTSYTSPYKFKPMANQSLLWPLEKNLTKTSANFRLKLEQRKKNTLTLSKQNQFKIKLPEKLPSKNPSLQKKKDQLVKRHEELGKQNLTKLYTYQECPKKGKTTKLAFGRQQKWSELMYYLSKPQVRDKIFDLLRKQFQLYDANE